MALGVDLSLVIVLGFALQGILQGKSRSQVFYA